MASWFTSLPEGEGKAVNKKQLQEFIKETLFEKSTGELSCLREEDCGEWPTITAVIVQTMSKASKDGDFSRIKPMIDFAFEKDLRARK
jgi:hypothetical protein